MSALNTERVQLKRPSIRITMTKVMLALIPGTLAYALFINPIIIANVVTSIVLAIAIEAIVLTMRNRSATQGIGDGSIVLAAWLFALCLPPMLPLWQLSVGVAMLAILGKHVYGGLGQNPFNPAMVGYAILLVSFPQTMTLWFAPQELNQFEFLDLLSLKMQIALPPLNTALQDTATTAIGFDALTQATQLEQIRIQRLQTNAPAPPETTLAWPWISAGFFLGGLYLLYQKIITWHIPLSLLLTLSVLHGVHNMLAGAAGLSFIDALLYGSAVFAAFFIATDPVTAATSKTGKLIFGAGIGALTFAIRAYGGYPDGIAFAVLLMNLCVPLIDQLSLRGRAS